MGGAAPCQRTHWGPRRGSLGATKRVRGVPRNGRGDAMPMHPPGRSIARSLGGHETCEGCAEVGGAKQCPGGHEACEGCSAWSASERLRALRSARSAWERLGAHGTEAPGSAWERLGAPGSAWERFVALGSALGCALERLGAPGSAWERLEAPESAWERLGAPGSAWERLRALGNASERLGALGRAWSAWERLERVGTLASA